jgi:ABC-type Zn uptake system ZnuABC Zn-binding protein ZnuA
LRINKTIMIAAVLALILAFPLEATLVKADSSKPVIVCTTSAVGSVVREYLGDSVDIVVLVQPSLCPADFDMKPSDIYAVSNAKILFKQNILGEFWLQGLLESAGTPRLIQVAIPGDYNTLQGAKNYVKWVGGNLSQILNIDLNTKISAMLADVDKVSNWMVSRGQSLQVSSMKVICMKWLKTFVESVGFQVVATYDPPETLSAGDITNLINTAKSEKVTLIVDNLQIDVEFGGGIASEVGAEHAVLTNFPGAIAGTENLTQMFRYNAEQLFNATNTWKSTVTLKAEMESLKGQVAAYQITTSLAVVILVVETVWLYMGRRESRAIRLSPKVDVTRFYSDESESIL